MYYIFKIFTSRKQKKTFAKNWPRERKVPKKDYFKFYCIFINKYQAIIAKFGRIMSKMKNRNSDFKNLVSNSVFEPKKQVFRIRFLTG